MRKKRILVIDDESSITRLLKMNLDKTQNYDVREENLASKGLIAAREFRPDLVLLDVMMPDMDGGDVAASIQADPVLRNTPIIFLTAVVKKEEVNAHDGRIGGFPYIAKPLNVRGVISVIEKELAKSN